MSIVISSDKYYKAIASKIKNVLGTETEYKPSEMAAAITDMQSVAESYRAITSGVVFSGDDAKIIGNKMPYGAFAGSDIKSFKIPENITEISPHAFYESSIENVIFHNDITTIGNEAFAYCDNLNIESLPDNLTSIGNAAFYSADIRGNLIIPNSVESIGKSAFTFNDDLTGVDIPAGVSEIQFGIVNYCDLKTLILRRESSVCTLNSPAYQFTDTPIKKGTGYIYVPSALLNFYRTATGWSTYASQFRALEEYTVDGTTTGAFDFSKV